MEIERQRREREQMKIDQQGGGNIIEIVIGLIVCSIVVYLGIRHHHSNWQEEICICESCKLSNGRAMIDIFFMFLLLFDLHHPPGDALLLNYPCLLLILLKDEYCLNHKLLI
jgi:hypothetical protein